MFTGQVSRSFFDFAVNNLDMIICVQHELHGLTVEMLIALSPVDSLAYTADVRSSQSDQIKHLRTSCYKRSSKASPPWTTTPMPFKRLKRPESDEAEQRGKLGRLPCDS